MAAIRGRPLFSMRHTRESKYISSARGHYSPFLQNFRASSWHWQCFLFILFNKNAPLEKRFWKRNDERLYKEVSLDVRANRYAVLMDAFAFWARKWNNETFSGARNAKHLQLCCFTTAGYPLKRERVSFLTFMCAVVLLVRKRIKNHVFLYLVSNAWRTSQVIMYTFTHSAGSVQMSNFAFFSITRLSPLLNAHLKSVSVIHTFIRGNTPQFSFFISIREIFHEWKVPSTSLSIQKIVRKTMPRLYVRVQHFDNQIIADDTRGSCPITAPTKTKTNQRIALENPTHPFITLYTPAPTPIGR